MSLDGVKLMIEQTAKEAYPKNATYAGKLFDAAKNCDLLMIKTAHQNMQANLIAGGMDVKIAEIITDDAAFRWVSL